MSRQFNFYSNFTCFKSRWEAMKEMDKVLDRLEGRLDRLTAVIQRTSMQERLETPGKIWKQQQTPRNP